MNHGQQTPIATGRHEVTFGTLGASGNAGYRRRHSTPFQIQTSRFEVGLGHFVGRDGVIHFLPADRLLGIEFFQAIGFTGSLCRAGLGFFKFDPILIRVDLEQRLPHFHTLPLFIQTLHQDTAHASAHFGLLGAFCLRHHLNHIRHRCRFRNQKRHRNRRRCFRHLLPVTPAVPEHEGQHNDATRDPGAATVFLPLPLPQRYQLATGRLFSQAAEVRCQSRHALIQPNFNTWRFRGRIIRRIHRHGIYRVTDCAELVIIYISACMYIAL